MKVYSQQHAPLGSCNPRLNEIWYASVVSTMEVGDMKWYPYESHDNTPPVNMTWAMCCTQYPDMLQHLQYARVPRREYGMPMAWVHARVWKSWNPSVLLGALAERVEDDASPHLNAELGGLVIEEPGDVGRRFTKFTGYKLVDQNPLENEGCSCEQGNLRVILSNWKTTLQ